MVKFFVNVITIAVICQMSLIASEEKRTVWIERTETVKFNCEVQPQSLVFNCVDCTIRERWDITDKHVPFFAPQSCVEVLGQQNRVKSKQKVRDFFSHIPVSVLQKKDGSWKKDGDSLLCCSIDNQDYELFLFNQCNIDGQSVHPYSVALTTFKQSLSQEKAQREKRRLLVFALSVLAPLSIQAKDSLFKKIYFFVLLNVYAKL